MARNTKAEQAEENFAGITGEIGQGSNEPLTLTEAPSAAQAEMVRHEERKNIGTQLQRIALRLNELGCMVASGKVLDAAVRLSKLKPGKVV